MTNIVWFICPDNQEIERLFIKPYNEMDLLKHTRQKHITPAITGQNDNLPGE